MALTCIKAPVCEPVALSDAKHFLKVDFDQDDGLIENLIKVARQAVEAYTGRCMIYQEWSFSFNAGYGQAVSDGHYLSGDKSRGQGGIELPKSPFVKLIQEPTLNDGYGIRPVKDYRLDQSGRTARLHFGSEVTGLTQGDGLIELTFAAGYGEEPKKVPEALRHGVLMMVAQLYENRTGVNDNPGLSIPMNDTVLQLVKPYQLLRVN